jgi:hypothetical protein
VNFSKLVTVLGALFLFFGCSSTNYHNQQGAPTKYVPPTEVGPVSGVGIESNDITSMTDQMMRDMLSNRNLAGRQISPRIIIDSEYFKNESSARTLNKNLITDRLRIQLNRSSEGRMVFVGRENLNMVMKERELKRAGQVDAGTIRTTAAVAGADFRLTGRISSLDSVSSSSAMTQRYYQISFEMYDLELGTIVWAGIYEFQKAAQDDVVYY